jgi:HSP20 family molecular chaperone IbpA
MSTIALRAPRSLADMLDWLETGTSPFLRDADNLVRVEDFVRDDRYVVRAEIPGIDPEKDVELTVEGDYLTIAGHRREEKVEKNHSEFRYGSFSRTLRLPAGTDASDITATYDDGVLEVSVPMATKEPSTRIPVTRAPAE